MRKNGGVKKRTGEAMKKAILAVLFLLVASLALAEEELSEEERFGADYVAYRTAQEKHLAGDDLEASPLYCRVVTDYPETIEEYVKQLEGVVRKELGEDVSKISSPQNYKSILCKLKEVQEKFQKDTVGYTVFFEKACSHCGLYLMRGDVSEQKELYDYLLDQCHKIKNFPLPSRHNGLQSWLVVLTQIEPRLVLGDAQALQQWRCDREKNTVLLLNALREYKFLWQSRCEEMEVLLGNLTESKMSDAELQEATVIKGDIFAPNAKIEVEIHPEKFSTDEKRERYQKQLQNEREFMNAARENEEERAHFENTRKWALILPYLEKYYLTKEDRSTLRKILKKQGIAEAIQEKITLDLTAGGISK